jgi:hypothetical protein
MRAVLSALLGVAALGQAALAQPPKPTVDVYVRSQAGLPASSARGDIEVVHMGDHALDAVFSVVGHRTAGGWRVSYVCAQSPSCDPNKFILAKAFDLKPDAARRVDAVIERIKAEPETDGQAPAPNQPCAKLAVAIDDHGSKRTWRRTCAWGAEFSELETLLKAGLP